MLAFVTRCTCARDRVNGLYVCRRRRRCRRENRQISSSRHCACCKHKEAVDIGEKLVSMCFELLEMAATNWAFSVLHACGLPITPTLLACARGQCRKMIVRSQQQQLLVQ